MRDYNWRKYQSKHHIKRKRDIIKYVYCYDDEYIEKYTPWRIAHRLDKGKIHCSCPMCSAKRKTQGYTYSDKKKYFRGYTGNIRKSSKHLNDKRIFKNNIDKESMEE